MGRVSYSKVSTYNQCPFLYKLKYLDNLKPLFDGKPNNPLVLGTAIHEGIESGSIDKAIESYKSNYESLDKNNELEILKMKAILPKALEQIPRGEYEYTLDIPDEFIGYIDCLVKNEDGTYDLIDFKYANDAKRYETSPQVHLYKYYFEKITGNKINNIYYAVIPKIKETLDDLSEEELLSKINDYSKSDIIFVPITFDMGKIYQFIAQKNLLESAKTFKKVYSSKCNWCPLQKYCRSNGEDRSEIEKKEEVKEVSLFA